MKRQILLMAALLCIAGQCVWGDNVTYLKLDFGDGNTTSISEVTNGTPETGSVWFTISGHKLQGAPTSKGIYIHNGKKYIKNKRLQ